MRVVPTSIPEVLIVEPTVHVDGRGFFLETYHADRYREHGIDGPFVQDNHSKSSGGTLRGLHLQLRRPQGKLVRVIERRDLRRRRRCAPGLGDLWPVGRRDVERRQLQAALHSTRLRARLLCAERDCRGRIQVHDRLRSAPTKSASPGTIRTLAVRWPIDQPTLSARDQQLPSLAQFLDDAGAGIQTEP